MECVVSVPHSGTRSLVDYLDLRTSPRGHWLHFGYDDARLDRVSLMHIPIRDPMEVATTWGRQGKNIQRLVTAYESMFNNLYRPHKLYKIEDIPKLQLNEAPDMSRDTDTVRQYKAVIQGIVDAHSGFFIKYYTR